MDTKYCNVIYFDRWADGEGTWTHGLSRDEIATLDAKRKEGKQKLSMEEEAKMNISALLTTFSQVYICKTGPNCISTIKSSISKTPEGVCTIVAVHISAEEDMAHNQGTKHVRSPSPTSRAGGESWSSDKEEHYGMHFLLHLTTEIKNQHFSGPVVPVAVLSRYDAAKAPTFPSGSEDSNAESPVATVWKDQMRSLRYLEAGAVDILDSPVTKDRVRSLPAHAYRSIKEFRNKSPFSSKRGSKKMSWVGVAESKPFAYLREVMVSGLMDRICDPDWSEPPLEASDLSVTPVMKEKLAKVMFTWTFSAHEFTDDELLYGALIMFEHTLTMPGLQRWKMPKEQITRFLMACRRVYNSFVLYHNFRHAVDVMQATFVFLIACGAIHPPAGVSPSDKRSPLTKLLTPFHALSLLVAALGHDVGHPGVNNLFLVTLNAPLAQLYNDRSVLESFHCAAYSQILRRYWPAAFGDTAMRKLMINIILATDMGLHAQYMQQLSSLEEKFVENNKTIDGWDDKTLDEYRELLCCLLIKCADICNVARKFEVATEWAEILTDEFSNQGVMEEELQMPSCLFGGPPVRDDIVQMATGQIGFMNIFGVPLFGNLAKLLPGMQFVVDEIEVNKGVWQSKIDEAEKIAKEGQPEDRSSKTSTANTKVESEPKTSEHEHRGSAGAASLLSSGSAPLGSDAFGPRPSTKDPSATAAASPSPELVASRRSSTPRAQMPGAWSSVTEGQMKKSSNAGNLDYSQCDGTGEPNHTEKDDEKYRASEKSLNPLKNRSTQDSEKNSTNSLKTKTRKPRFVSNKFLDARHTEDASRTPTSNGSPSPSAAKSCNSLRDKFSLGYWKRRTMIKD